MAITLSAESPLQDDVRALIAELNGVLLALTSPEFCFHMTAEEMAQLDTMVFLARDDGVAVACGALRRHAQGVGEVKRMYTRPSHQGLGIGGRILAEIEALARARGSPAWCWRPAIVMRRPGGSTSAAVLLAAARCSTIQISEYSVFYAKTLREPANPGLPPTPNPSPRGGGEFAGRLPHRNARR